MSPGAKCLTFILLTLWTTIPAAAQRVDIQAVNKKYHALSAQGNYAAALTEARKLEAAVRALGGTQHPNYPIVLEYVGNSLAGLGNYAEAFSVHQRVLAIRERMYGPQSKEAADSHNNLANNALKQGQYASAEAAYNRALEIYRSVHGADSPDAASTLENLGVLYSLQGRYADAETASRQVISIRERAFGDTHPSVAESRQKLGALYQSMGRFADAERLMTAALASLGQSRNQVTAAQALNNLGILHSQMGKLAVAEAEFRQALEIEERLLGGQHPAVAEVIQNLAATLKLQCRYEEAERLLTRVTAIREKALRPDHPDVASSLINLANLHVASEKFDQADALYRRALAIQQRALKDEHPNVAATLHNLAYAAEARRQYEVAADLLQRAIRIRESALGREHPDLARSLHSLGNVRLSQGRLDESEQLYKSALSVFERSVGLDHPDMTVFYHALARLEAERRNSAAALDWARKASTILIERLRVSAAANEEESCSLEQRGRFFGNHLLQLSTVAGAGQRARFASEAFEVAQWASQSTASAALQQMGARVSAGSDQLAGLVREAQDLSERKRALDKLVVAGIAKEAGNTIQQSPNLRAELAEIRQRLAVVNGRLARDFPAYAALTNPKPASIKEAQAALRPDEVMAVWAVGDKQTELFALTRETAEWHSLPLGAEALSGRVADFRRGLDVEAAQEPLEASKLFDLQLAHQLYNDLLAPVQHLLRGKRHLIVVPSKALTAIPFQLLLTGPPAARAADFAQYRSADWLIKQHAISVMPSVASLLILRTAAQMRPAPKPMLGFGDPVFQLPAQAGNTRGQQRPESAAAKTRSYAEFWQGGNVDPARLGEALSRLPETADEIRIVAQKLRADESDIYLGAAATETTAKNVPIDNYRVVYFATHGLVAGDVKGLAEPSLALSLPRKPSQQDDGLLTASEIAQLKMNADWVILSACNTIAGDKPGAEALSGLARAFFYAGTRALLVSHWAVASDAATSLTTATFETLAADPKIGRAEALRRAMLAYLGDETKPVQAYPAFWAPFVVVGEAGAN